MALSSLFISAGVASGVFTIRRSNKLNASLFESTMNSCLCIGYGILGSSAAVGFGSYFGLNYFVDKRDLIKNWKSNILYILTTPKPVLSYEQEEKNGIASVFFINATIVFGGMLLFSHCGTIGSYAAARGLHRHFMKNK